MKKINILLPEDLALLVNNAVVEGYYLSMSEVISDALRDWKSKHLLNLEGTKKVTQKWHEDTQSEYNSYRLSTSDELYAQAVKFVAVTRNVSISGIQLQFRIGYNRASSIIEEMESRGFVSAADLNGKRYVLLPAPILE